MKLKRNEEKVIPFKRGWDCLPFDICKSVRCEAPKKANLLTVNPRIYSWKLSRVFSA